MNMPELLRRFEHLIVKSLMLMMAIVVFLATVELAYILVKDIVSSPMFLLNIDELQEIFGMFMLVLIGLELFESIQIYHKDRVVRVEIVILVAIIAVARKVIRPFGLQVPLDAHALGVRSGNPLPEPDLLAPQDEALTVHGTATEKSCRASCSGQKHR